MPRKKLNEIERAERARERKREWKRRNQTKRSVKLNNIVYIRKRREDPEYRALENMKRRRKKDNQSIGISSSCDNTLIDQKTKDSKERLKKQKREWKKRNQSKESIKMSNMIYMRKRRSDPEYRANENIKRRRKTGVEKKIYNQAVYDSFATQDSEVYKTIIVGDVKLSFANDE